MSPETRKHIKSAVIVAIAIALGMLRLWNLSLPPELDGPHVLVIEGALWCWVSNYILVTWGIDLNQILPPIKSQTASNPTNQTATVTTTDTPAV